ncbi:MAG: DUF2062 domain-containing protein [Paenibacillaceae bacterium]
MKLFIRTKGRQYKRYVKFYYLKLLRIHGAASIVARSFAAGLFIEFITLPTLGAAFLLLYPLTRLVRGRFSAALIGFVAGKLIAAPFLYMNYSIGYYVVHDLFHSVMIGGRAVAFLIGSGITGIVFAFISYWIVFILMNWYRKQRLEKRHLRSKVGSAQ